MSDQIQVWSCGGGVQSAAIGALIVQDRLPKPDFAVIVDTERERESTWQYFDTVLHPALLAVGVDIVRVRKSDYATVDLWGGADGDTCLIPAFTDGAGKLPGYCSNEWKSRVVSRWLRAQGVVPTKAKTWIGISVDEMRRVRSGQGNRYPLIFDVTMRREGCLALVRSMGWPQPPRSSCWMCPNAVNDEWRRLRDEWPDDWQRAIDLEREIRSRDPRITLHRSGLPLDQSPIDKPESDQLDMFDNMCAGMCWV